MKEYKFNQNYFLQKKGNHTRSKSIKLSEIKNLYCTNLNKSINGPIKAHIHTENAIKVKPLVTEPGSKNVLNVSKEEKSMIGKLKNKENLKKNQVKNNNSLMNYLTNARNNRNFSAIYKNKSIYKLKKQTITWMLLLMIFPLISPSTSP